MPHDTLLFWQCIPQPFCWNIFICIYYVHLVEKICSKLTWDSRTLIAFDWGKEESTGTSIAKLNINFSLRKKYTTNKEEKVAHSQNNNKHWSEKRGACSFNLSSQKKKINFCPFYSWLIVSVRATGPAGGSGSSGHVGVGDNYCYKVWFLTPLLLSACWSTTGKNKPRSVTPASTQLLPHCAVTTLPGSDVSISQLALGFHKNNLNKKTKTKTDFFLCTVYCT